MNFIIYAVVALFIFYFVFHDLKAAFCALFHIWKAVPYAVKDIVSYIKNKGWKKFNNTGIIMFGGLFGTGKTLAIVHYAESIYKRYDNVEIISNVTLENVPFTKFKYFEQLTEPTPPGKILVYVCDEFGSLFNSRNYNKTTITEAEYLRVLNQLRKDNKLLLISTQRYGMLDKVFRQVSKCWYECGHVWRFYWRYAYDPYDLEYTNDPRLVKPVKFFPEMIFASDKVYSAYNTHEIVNSFENVITITDRADTSSAVNADYKYSAGAKRKYYRR